MLKLVLRSDDELCHVAVYSWLIERGLIDKLLQVSFSYSKFIFIFLILEIEREEIARIYVSNNSRGYCWI